MNDLQNAEVGSIELPTGIFLPATMLMDYGCRHCFFKANGRCPLGLKGDEQNELGYCDTVIGFLASLASDGDTITDVKEKYQIEVMTLQANADFSEFKELESELKTRLANGEEGPKVEALQMRVQAYKMWWSRLNENSSKALSKINDRVARKEDKNINVNHKIDLNQLHSIMNDVKVIEYKDGNDDD